MMARSLKTLALINEYRLDAFLDVHQGKPLREYRNGETVNSVLVLGII
jgi:hypothetical protein